MNCNRAGNIFYRAIVTFSAILEHNYMKSLFRIIENQKQLLSIPPLALRRIINNRLIADISTAAYASPFHDALPLTSSETSVITPTFIRQKCCSVLN
jgi:hypothetical protein